MPSIIKSRLTSSYDNPLQCPSWIPNKPNGDGDVSLSSFQDDSADIILNPNQLAPVRINLFFYHLPPIDLSSFPLNKLGLSTRSCLAQSGIFLSLSDESILSDEQISLLQTGSAINIGGFLKNYGRNKILLKKGDHLARFFLINDDDSLPAIQIKQLLKNGLVEGKEGEDYAIINHQDNNPRIALRIQPEEYQISSREAIRISSRQDLYQFIAPQLIRAKSQFHLTQTTAKINLPKNIIGVISAQIDPPPAIHLPSRLIDPGTHWKIRLEILGTIPHNIPSWVTLNLYKSPLLSFNTRHRLTTYASCLLSSAA